jgi:NIF3 (NGG1p interacting factor 3).
MKLKEIMDWFDRTAPLQLQESYDNSGLIIGDKEQTVNRAVVCLDVDEAVLEYAVKKAQTLSSHIIRVFSGP